MSSPTYYRSQAEAAALRNVAMDVVDEIERLLPDGEFELHRDTLFVGRTAPAEVGCIAATLPDIAGSLTALEFELSEDPGVYADALIRFREKLRRPHSL